MPEEVREYIAGAMLVRGWSGLLPDPESFAKYPEHVRARMVAWNDARIIDESKRLDAITAAWIKQETREDIFTFIVNIGAALLSFVSFVITQNPASFGFLAIPGAAVVINGVHIIIGAGKKEKTTAGGEKK